MYKSEFHHGLWSPHGPWRYFNIWVFCWLLWLGLSSQRQEPWWQTPSCVVFGRKRTCSGTHLMKAANGGPIHYPTRPQGPTFHSCALLMHIIALAVQPILVLHSSNIFGCTVCWLAPLTVVLKYRSWAQDHCLSRSNQHHLKAHSQQQTPTKTSIDIHLLLTYGTHTHTHTGSERLVCIWGL